MRQPGSAYRSGEEIYNISYFIEKPNQFIRIFQNTIVQVGDVHLQEAIGSLLGRLNIRVPWFILIGFILLICICAIRRRDEAVYVKKGHRLFIALICCASVVLVLLSMLLSYTQQSSNYITGVQGRYYLPIVAVLLLGMRNSKMVRDYKDDFLILLADILNVLVVGFVLLSALIN